GDRLYVAAEGFDVRDALFEQVADAGGGVAEQFLGIPAVDVLREHDHPDVRMSCAYIDRGAQSVLGVIGRHPDVGQQQIGMLALDERGQLAGVSGRCDDGEPCAVEQEDEPFSKQRLVLTYDDAHGISAMSTVPKPAAVSTSS